MAVGVASIALIVVVAQSGRLGLQQVAEASAEIALIGNAQRLQQDADQMHDALRADVFHALYSDARTPAEVAEVVEDVEQHSEQLRADLLRIRQLALPPDLARVLDDESADLDAYAEQAETLVRLAFNDRAAAVELVEPFEESFHELSTVQQAATGRLADAATDARTLAEQRQMQAQGRVVVSSAVVVAALVALTLGLNRIGGNLTGVMAQLRSDATRRRFGNELSDALEMADDELAGHEIIQRAMDEIAPGRPMELLLADSSEAHLERTATSPSGGAPCCPVESPWGCVAVRRATAVTFESSSMLNACPKLRGRDDGPRSATCVPVSFMGRALGVLHATGPDGEPPSAEQEERLVTLAGQAGTRIGTLRAFARTELQASTDGLTGIANRRSLEERVRLLRQRGRRFCLALGDLDHFKVLNDTHGHDAGDRALRVFTRTISEGLRGDDMVARIGGEEFVVVFPEVDIGDAVDALERLRAQLTRATADGASPAFTVSFGVADSDAATGLDELLRVADRALYRAKELGRDQVVMAGDTRSPPASDASVSTAP